MERIEPLSIDQIQALDWEVTTEFTPDPTPEPTPDYVLNAGDVSGIGVIPIEGERTAEEWSAANLGTLGINMSGTIGELGIYLNGSIVANLNYPTPEPDPKHVLQYQTEYQGVITSLVTLEYPVGEVVTLPTNPEAIGLVIPEGYTFRFWAVDDQETTEVTMDRDIIVKPFFYLSRSRGYSLNPWPTIFSCGAVPSQREQRYKSAILDNGYNDFNYLNREIGMSDGYRIYEAWSTGRPKIASDISSSVQKLTQNFLGNNVQGLARNRRYVFEFWFRKRKPSSEGAVTTNSVYLGTAVGAAGTPLPPMSESLVTNFESYINGVRTDETYESIGSPVEATDEWKVYRSSFVLGNFAESTIIVGMFLASTVNSTQGNIVEGGIEVRNVADFYEVNDNIFPEDHFGGTFFDGGTGYPNGAMDNGYNTSNFVTTKRDDSVEYEVIDLWSTGAPRVFVADVAKVSQCVLYRTANAYGQSTKYMFEFWFRKRKPSTPEAVTTNSVYIGCLHCDPSARPLPVNKNYIRNFKSYIDSVVTSETHMGFGNPVEATDRWRHYTAEWIYTDGNTVQHGVKFAIALASSVVSTEGNIVEGGVEIMGVGFKQIRP